MVRKILKYVGIVIACLVVLVALSALLYREYLQHKVAEQRAIRSPNGINSLEPVRIGGIDQWMEVRGQNVSNPILLFIHGGPGIAFIPLASTFQSPWEKYFTVVQWDQRGAGKTYASNDKELQRKTMNVPQMEQDALEVVNYLRNRFKREKIFIIGHSWGAILGLWLAYEHPEVIYAYVGTGQAVNLEENAALVYKGALQQARNRRNEQAVNELESIAPYPPPNPDLRKMMIANKWAGNLAPPPPSGPESRKFPSIVSVVVSAPEYSLVDDLGFFRGQMFSAQALIPQLANLDLTKLGSNFRAPVFFFEGRYDPWCPPSLIWEYAQTIKGPQKGFVWFEHSGHFPFLEEQQKFTDELVQRVLPLANTVN